MAVDLITEKEGAVIQAFPLTDGKINKTTGTIEQCSMIACVVDGSITLVKFNVTVDMVAGDVYTFANQSVTVVSGKFHLA